MNSKRKILLILLCTILITIIGGVIVFAYNENSSSKNSILTYEKISSIENIYKEVIPNEETLKGKANSINEKFDLSIIKQFDSNNIANKENSIYDVKYYRNELDSITEAIVQIDNKLITYNADTNDFISYIELNKICDNCDYDETTIKEIATEIFSNLTIVDNSNDYVFVEITQFDDSIWFAQFAKQYDGIINLGESIKFSFSPKTKEIISIAKKDIKYENNSVLLTEDEAKSIAQELKNSPVIDSNLEIVIPNYSLENNNNIYKNINIARKAYVLLLDDELKTKIYIDATTGEAIGCTNPLGGEW